ncbi:hypothetical protein [Kitasatospora sp. NPDC094011]|uniref:hypothetical protein n=1 Tax=Kitasatospora sp. NPDC094011 TaxID=3364090 RepID=UPI003805CF9E
MTPPERRAAAKRRGPKRHRYKSLLVRRADALQERLHAAGMTIWQLADLSVSTNTK